MRIFTAVGMGAFFLMGLVVGVRLIALGWRNHQWPELLIGAGLLSLGPLSFPAAVTAIRLLDTLPELGAPILGYANSRQVFDLKALFQRLRPSGFPDGGEVPEELPALESRAALRRRGHYGCRVGFSERTIRRAAMLSTRLAALAPRDQCREA